MYGPLKDGHGELIIIGRQDAATQGRSFFYTGKPCRKRGHMSVRYVSNGCCRACLNQTFKAKINPWTNKLIPFVNAHLWTGAHLNKLQRIALRVYLQKCIFTFLRANMEELGFNGKVELEAAMQEIEERGQYANIEDPRNTD